MVLMLVTKLVIMILLVLSSVNVICEVLCMLSTVCVRKTTLLYLFGYLR